GSTTAGAIAGIASFTNLSYPVAESMTIAFSSGVLSNAISSTVAVGPGSFAKLQLLAPGESSAPGTAIGKTGTPVAQTAGSPFTPTLNAVDSNWNVVTNVNDLVGVTSSDINAGLPANAAMTNGALSFSVTLKTAGNAPLAAT